MVVVKKARRPNRLRQAHRCARANDAVKELRIHQVYKMLVSGAGRGAILQFTAKKWGLSVRQSDDYIAVATTLVKVEAAKVREELFSEQVVFRRVLREQAYRTNDLRLALDVARDEAKLHDLYPAERHRVDTWESEIVELVRQGKLTPQDVLNELGNEEQARAILVAAGAFAVSGATAETHSEREARGGAGPGNVGSGATEIPPGPVAGDSAAQPGAATPVELQPAERQVNDDRGPSPPPLNLY